MVLIDSSWRDDSNGGHIIKSDENHALDQICISGAVVADNINLISDGDYWQFLVHSITGKGI